jgi:hypothetical protein
VFGDVTFAQAPFAALGGNTFVTTVSESATASSVFSSDAISTAQLNEISTALASFIATLSIFAVASESATATDLPNFAASILNATASESASGADSPSADKVANVYVQGVQLYVSIGDVLVWAVIDDSQNANWQNINNEQGSGWTLIPTPSNPGWNNLPS